MTLTPQDVQASCEDALRGPLPSSLSVQSLCNRVGEFLIGCRGWGFLRRPVGKLNVRPKVALASAAWTASTKTLAETGAFAGYTWLEGDTIDITTVSGGTPGTYQVATRVDDDSVTLYESIKATDSASGIVGTSADGFGAAALPSDFGALTATREASVWQYCVHSTDLDTLTAYRLATPTYVGSQTMGAIAYGQNPLGGPPVRRLELYPTPTSAEVGKILLAYRAGWLKVTSDTQVLAIPEYLDALFLELALAYAQGRAEHDQATVEMRLTAALQAGTLGSLYRSASNRDMREQPSYGPITNGHMSRGRLPATFRVDSSQVSYPGVF